MNMSRRVLLSAAALALGAVSAAADTTVEAIGVLSGTSIAGWRIGEYVHLKYNLVEPAVLQYAPSDAWRHNIVLASVQQTVRGQATGYNLGSSFTARSTLANNYPVADVIIVDAADGLSFPMANGAIQAFELHDSSGTALTTGNSVGARGFYPASAWDYVEWAGVVSGSGTYSVQFLAMSMHDPATATGACCPGDGFCMVTTQAICPGSWAEGAPCTAELCAAAGACCLENGACILRTPTDCSAFFNSVYNGDNTACQTGGCPPAAPCCLSGDCQILTEAACAAGEGHWLGVGASCSIQPQDANVYPSPFLPITDATFNAGGDIPRTTTSTLVLSDPTIIQSLEVWVGMFHGRLMDVKLEITGPNGVTLPLLNRFGSTNNCTTMPIGPGHAMNGNFIFQDGAGLSIHDYLSTLGTGQAALGGRYEPSSCDGGLVSLTAPSPAGFGGIPLAGTWTLTITDAKSGVTGNLGLFGISINGGNPAPCSLGACCVGSSCTPTTFAQCGASGGEFTAGGACDPNPCSAAAGACCIGASCTINVDASLCALNGGTFDAGNSCAITAGPPHSFCCPTNFDRNLVKNVADIFAGLGAYFAADTAMDWDGLGGTTLSDFFLFFGEWFAPC